MVVEHMAGQDRVVASSEQGQVAPGAWNGIMGYNLTESNGVAQVNLKAIHGLQKIFFIGDPRVR